MSVLTNGKAVKTKSMFRMEIAVAININATPAKIWALLTHAKDFPRWNSTIQSIDGVIAMGEKVKLKAKISPDRTFNLLVTKFEPNATLVWQDGMAPMFKGIRTYTLTSKNDGTTDVSMVEVFSGLMLPMIASSLPDFSPSFEQYATDLKKEAELAR
jgi:hypothetical protein